MMINLKAFRQIIRAVELTPESHLNMRVWAEETECGTVECF